MQPDKANLILNIVGGLLIAMAFLQFAATVRAYGDIRLCPFVRMLKLSIRGRRVFLVFVFAPALLATTVLHQVSPGTFLPMPLGIGIGLLSFVFNSVFVPPSVLLLGNSCPSTLGFVVTVIPQIMPLRSLHLLNTERGFANEVTLRESCHRVFTNWRKAVVDVVEYVPCIVMDLRGYSSAVHFELNHLFEAGAFRRTVFIVDAKSVHILSSICPPATAPGLCVTTAPQFLAAIRRFGMATFRRERGSVFIPIRKAL